MIDTFIDKDKTQLGSFEKKLNDNKHIKKFDNNYISDQNDLENNNENLNKINDTDSNL